MSKGQKRTGKVVSTIEVVRPVVKSPYKIVPDRHLKRVCRRGGVDCVYLLAYPVGVCSVGTTQEAMRRQLAEEKGKRARCPGPDSIKE
jgi:hypothetical protein